MWNKPVSEQNCDPIFMDVNDSSLLKNNKPLINKASRT